VPQIIHLDLDAFYATVEMLLDPSLRGKPLIVAMGDPRRDPNGRGVVATASYEARKFGVHSAMPLRQAVRLCPQAVIVPVRHALYSEHSRRVMDLLREFTPLVEQVSIDEAYLEIPPEQDAGAVARAIQARIHDELGLSCTLAVASNKLVSKIACNTVKPRGFLVVPPGDEESFLAPLPVGKLPGAGQVTRARLKRWNVETIGDLARVPPEELAREFGKHGIYLSEGARGRDDSPIVTEWEPKSISQEETFERDVRTPEPLEAYLAEMSERVARELEGESYLARTVVLKLRYSDFTTITRQTTLRVPTRDAQLIHRTVHSLLHKHWDRHRAVRLIGVGVHNLLPNDAAWQLELHLE
jgi:nucleotidyltransferase/DNA polymerase involved in DNA repair